MNLLFFSYWGISDGLTHATVLPHLEILSKRKDVEQIILCTIERGNDTPNILFANKKIIHEPLISSWKYFRLLNKVYDFGILPQKIKSLLIKYNISVLIARGAPTGALALRVLNKKLQFIVESFEPHAQYMLESTVWSKNSLSYILGKKWENQILKKADQIITVSSAYQTELQKSILIKNKLYVGPCAVNLSDFKFSQISREKKRNELNIQPNALIGIYVGKFGGLYLELEQAVELFGQFLKRNPLNQILILSPDDHGQIKYICKKYGITSNRIIIETSKHEDVHQFLSASDFAFALYKLGKSKMALSPIKIGEYWANGLPTLIPRGIGDDSKIIFENRIGSEIYMDNFDKTIDEFADLVNSRSREEWNLTISPFAKKYRSFSKIEEIYDEILK